jgi:small conductance mechanosensitive channel
MDTILMRIQDFAALYGLKVIGAVVIIIVGKWASRVVSNITKRLMTRGKIDEILVSFAGNLVYIAFLAFAIIAALGQLGIQTASFIAVLGAAGLAIGFALQGSLSNFASGVMLIFFRPFKKGDYVEAGGVSGIVEDIQIFHTALKTPDNKAVIVPNSGITGGNITNFSAKEVRRVDMVFGVGYDDDLKKVREILEDILRDESRIIENPPHTIAVLELADSSVNFAVRPWVNTADYWNVYFDITEEVKLRFDAEGISIPYPQRDVHMHSVGA